MSRELSFGLSVLLASCILALPLPGMSAGSNVPGHFSANGVDDVVFPTAKQACDDWVRKKVDGGSPSARKPEFAGGIAYWCFWKHGDGTDQDRANVYLGCPSDSHPEGEQCVCDSSYVSDGKGCVRAEEGAEAAGESTEEAPGKHDEPGSEDAGTCDSSAMTAQQEEALTQWMGKKFTQVPLLDKHWNASATEQQRNEVQGLKSDPKTNQDHRRKYFNPTRDRFWTAVYGDAKGARAMLERSGVTFTTPGKPPQMSINGKMVILDVDHITGLAVEPSRMIDPDNLRLVSDPENRKSLEQIKRVDPFQSPEAAKRWINKQKDGKGKPCQSSAPM